MSCEGDVAVRTIVILNTIVDVCMCALEGLTLSQHIFQNPNCKMGGTTTTVKRSRETGFR
jgi:hypothetical protein